MMTKNRVKQLNKRHNNAAAPTRNLVQRGQQQHRNGTFADYLCRDAAVKQAAEQAVPPGDDDEQVGPQLGRALQNADGGIGMTYQMHGGGGRHECYAAVTHGVQHPVHGGRGRVFLIGNVHDGEPAVQRIE